MRRPPASAPARARPRPRPPARPGAVPCRIVSCRVVGACASGRVRDETLPGGPRSRHRDTAVSDAPDAVGGLPLPTTTHWIDPSRPREPLAGRCGRRDTLRPTSSHRSGFGMQATDLIERAVSRLAKAGELGQAVEASPRRARRVQRWRILGGGARFMMTPRAERRVRCARRNGRGMFTRLLELEPSGRMRPGTRSHSLKMS